MNKRLQQIDSETGEIIDGFVAYVVPKRKNGFGQGWLAMAQNGAEILSQSNLRERLQSADEAAVCPGLREPNPSQPSRYCQRIGHAQATRTAKH